MRGATILAAADDAPLDLAIYHCQQAAEKAVKAYLQWRDEPFAKTHNLRALVIQATTLDKGFDAFEKPAEVMSCVAFFRQSSEPVSQHRADSGQTSQFSLTPRLQPGDPISAKSFSRFNGFRSGVKPLKRFVHRQSPGPPG